MVGTPQLPLKYRRKGVSDYWLLPPNRDMQIHSTSGFDPYKCGSDCSVPYSPTFCSSSSSVTPSSPVRSLHTPEPSSSPAPEPYIASSPKSPPRPGRKGFWEVAFNYGPDFPYKGRPCAQSPDCSREQFRTRRRSSSASAPTLISDVEPSEYSDFNDPFNMDDDATDEEERAGNVTFVNYRDKLALSGSRDSDLPQDAASSSKSWTGEMDVAAVLLDLSRQVRSGSVDSRTEDIAISNMTALNPAREELVDPVSDESSWTSQDLVINNPVQSDDSAQSMPHAVEQEKNPSNLRECETHGQEPFLEETSICPQASDPSAEVHPRSYVTGDPFVERFALQQANLNLNAASEDTELDDVGIDIPGSHGHVIKSTERCPTIANEQGAIPVHQSVFSGALTPLSSPALTGSDLSDLSEPLSGLSSPRNSANELTGPSDNTQQGRESRCLNAHSPVPGPSTHQIGSADQHVAVTKEETPQLRQQSCKDRPATELDANAGAQQPAQKTKEKRARSNSATESSSLRPSPSLGPDVPRPRKKRSKKTERSRSTPQAGDACMQSCSSSSLASTSACTLSSHDDSSACAVDPVAVPISDYCDAEMREELCGCLTQAMALSRASSMPASSLLREVLRENPHLADQRTRSNWLRLISLVLESHELFGRVDRKGFDADDKPLEPQWFYVPEKDPDQERAFLLREMMPKKRAETKKHKQYFFKPLGKFSRWEREDAP